jgi:heat-inducible transcriptional repressor
MPNRQSNLSTQPAQIPDARGQVVLSAVIKEHLLTGEPVGSRAVSSRFSHGAGWSSATVRHVMAELEEAGFVEQPHTSAGRVPTDMGYRFYVDHMLGEAHLLPEDMAAINELLGGAADDPVGSANVTANNNTTAPDRLMAKTSHLLSAISENVGIVISPSLAENRLRHIEFMQLADKRILVVLVSTANIIHNKIIRLDEQLSQLELERTARYLNTEFSGKSLRAIRSEILQLMREEKSLYDELLRHAILLCSHSLEGEEACEGEVYIDGASNILAKPDFPDVERMRELLRTFEEKSRLVKILNECVGRGAASEVQVSIGREHAAPSMYNCTLITAPYRIGEGDAVGALGVVGPMRIEYERMMCVVNYIARLVERMLVGEKDNFV